MGSAAIDFVPWGLEATWPSRRWLEPLDGRRDGPPRGVRLGHASDSALVLVCTYPRARVDAEMPGTGADLVRELAFEATFALINFALHQIKVPGRRPEGFVGSLVSYANQQADRYLDWGTTHWGIGPAAQTTQQAWPGQPGRTGQQPQAAQQGWTGQQPQAAQPGRTGQQGWTGQQPQAAPTGQNGRPAWGEPASQAAGGLRASGAVARTIGLGGWRSGFSLANPDAYIVVHACGISLDHLLLTPVTDPSAYGLAAEPPLLGEMHWELWPNHQELGYDDLALLVGAR
jgi:hypothetical protein